MKLCAARNTSQCVQKNWQYSFKSPQERGRSLQLNLDMLLEEGKISINKRGRYEAVRSSAAKKEAEKKSVKAERKKGQYYTGTFISHPRGFGFLEIPEAEEDIFIPEESIGTALHGDTVQIVVEKTAKTEKDVREKLLRCWKGAQGKL